MRIDAYSTTNDPTLPNHNISDALAEEQIRGIYNGKTGAGRHGVEVSFRAPVNVRAVFELRRLVASVVAVFVAIYNCDAGDRTETKASPRAWNGDREPCIQAKTKT